MKEFTVPVTEVMDQIQAHHKNKVGIGPFLANSPKDTYVVIYDDEGVMQDPIVPSDRELTPDEARYVMEQGGCDTARLVVDMMTIRPGPQRERLAGWLREIADSLERDPHTPPHPIQYRTFRFVEHYTGLYELCK